MVNLIVQQFALDETLMIFFFGSQKIGFDSSSNYLLRIQFA